MDHAHRRLIVVSNRLPVVVKDDGDGGHRVEPGSGGLVSALGPVLAERGGRWIGWLGAADEVGITSAIEGVSERLGYRLDGVPLDAGEVAAYYHGFSNEVLWPLCHDFISHCNFDPAFWPVYQEVNRKFAAKVAEVTEADDYVWINDYHLMLVARELHAHGIERELGFFLHIPFPPLDVFTKMPWRAQILEGLLEYDLVGFQTERDVRNFLQCVTFRIEDALIEEQGEVTRIRTGSRELYVGAFPISIDYDDFVERCVEQRISESVARLRSALPNRSLILGLDRLDYSKGIPNRILAFANALDRYPELRRKVTFIQIVVPSRTRVEEYAHLRDEIDRLVGHINGQYTAGGWSPIQYIFRSLSETELLAYYRGCDIALITPLKDGMNLVAKEYCACSLEGNGVLILSEFAGAASQLSEGALMVNPFDIEQVADAIKQAVDMPDDERAQRMSAMRESIRIENVFRWVERYLDIAQRCSDGARSAPTLVGE
jgi:trehalose 6-phosphate synthase